MNANIDTMEDPYIHPLTDIAEAIGIPYRTCLDYRKDLDEPLAPFTTKKRKGAFYFTDQGKEFFEKIAKLIAERVKKKEILHRIRAEISALPVPVRTTEKPKAIQPQPIPPSKQAQPDFYQLFQDERKARESDREKLETEVRKLSAESAKHEATAETRLENIEDLRQERDKWHQQANDAIRSLNASQALHGKTMLEAPVEEGRGATILDGETLNEVPEPEIAERVTPEATTGKKKKTKKLSKKDQKKASKKIDKIIGKDPSLIEKILNLIKS
jgi:hypothetical protein